MLLVGEVGRSFVQEVPHDIQVSCDDRKSGVEGGVRKNAFPSSHSRKSGNLGKSAKIDCGVRTTPCLHKSAPCARLEENSENSRENLWLRALDCLFNLGGKKENSSCCNRAHTFTTLNTSRRRKRKISRVFQFFPPPGKN